MALEERDWVPNELFRHGMNGEWKEFSEVFCRFEGAKSCIITRNNETALHIAVAAGQTKFVSDLMQSLERSASKILAMKNKNGNTPLHLAAALGNIDMCKSIAEVHPDLINIRNNVKESPLFLAARHGQEGAFFSLHSIWKANKNPKELDYYDPCRGYEGNNILHAAISGEYFSFALKIIGEYPQLVDGYNTQGSTPLHVLATKPDVFQSGHSFGRLDRFIYYCILASGIDEKADSKKEKDDSNKDSSCKFPKNCKTCIFYLLKILWLFLAKLLNIKKQTSAVEKDPTTGTQKSTDEENPIEGENQKGKIAQIFPPNYETEVFFFSLVVKLFLIIMGFGFQRIQNIRNKKVRHDWAIRVMNEMVGKSSYYKSDRSGSMPAESQSINELAEVFEDEPKKSKESAFLIAAKRGVIEMVQKILEKYPVAIWDLDSEDKNVVLLAVENRQIEVYKLIHGKAKFKENLFHQVDNEGNSVVHLAALLQEEEPSWHIYGPALQMQWEYKWYKYVKESMGPNFFIRHNKKGKTPKDLLIKSHQQLVKEGSKWLTKTSESCSVVAALNATVAFATTSQVPGGLNDQNGAPKMEEKATFSVFAISALVSLGFSVTALVYFLAIITSRFQHKEFRELLPRRLFMGLSALFVSIASILVTFCFGHYFIVGNDVKPYVYPVYVVTSLPACIFLLAQLSLYFDLYTTTIRHEPPHPNRKLRS